MALTPLTMLQARVAQALYDAFGPTVRLPKVLVQPTRDPRHGDYTCAAAMALARTFGRPPDELALRLAAVLDVTGVCEAPEVVAPGFVNLRLRDSWLGERVGSLVGDDTLGLAPASKPAHLVIDYSGPNVAKEMHVGHLRSTIIGDCLANVAEHRGDTVERVSHIGDWGTQFGMLIAHLDEVAPGAGAGEPIAIDDVADFYRQASARFGADPTFAEAARRRVVDLQSGEPRAGAAWRSLVELSAAENRVVYDQLGVGGLVERGESTYQPQLAGVVADLEAAGLVVVDDGARCVFVPGFTNTEETPPLIVQKADGGYNYATTDLAALRSRIEGAPIAWPT